MISLKVLNVMNNADIDLFAIRINSDGKPVNQHNSVLYYNHTRIARPTEVGEVGREVLLGFIDTATDDVRINIKSHGEWLIGFSNYRGSIEHAEIEIGLFSNDEMIAKFDTKDIGDLSSTTAMQMGRLSLGTKSTFFGFGSKQVVNVHGIMVKFPHISDWMRELGLYNEPAHPMGPGFPGPLKNTMNMKSGE